MQALHYFHPAAHVTVMLEVTANEIFD